MSLQPQSLEPEMEIDSTLDELECRIRSRGAMQVTDAEVLKMIGWLRESLRDRRALLDEIEALELLGDCTRRSRMS